MEPCPFCKTPIAEDLVRFGGSCPHCFIEIPGEEAPTNPGAQPSSGEAPPPPGKGAGLGVIAALIALLAVGGGFLAWRTTADVEPIAEGGEDADFYMVPLSEVPEGERPPEGEEGGGDAVASLDPSTPQAYQDPTYKPPAADQAALTPKIGRPDSAGDPMVMPSFQATALSDPAMIREMVQGVIGKYKGQMKYCYEQQLKNNESLKGIWYLTFTIQTTGAVSNVRAFSSSASNPELEACMVRKASAWRFQRVSESQYIQQYPFRFGV
jgi:hypothetical protein